jgi:cyclase
MITSIDREGTGLGYDTDLTKLVSESVSIPVIACGGAGKIEHLSQVVSEGKADAIAVASILHYDFIKNNEVVVDSKSEGNIEFLKSGKTFSKVEPSDLYAIKEHMLEKGINCRFINHSSD